MVRPPVRRQYSRRGASGVRDVDSARQARFARAFGWLGVAGLMWGGLVGSLVGGVGGALLGGLAGVVLVGGGGGLVILLVTDRLGGMAGALYNPSGRTTPHRHDHSYAKSLVARGAFEEAIRAYEDSVALDPADPTPYVAVARILRDELGSFEEAARWFRRARLDAQLDPGYELLVGRELVELYRGRLAQPRRAAPELARLAERFEGTPEGEWAESELRSLKEEIADER